jgi:hypothetical protein
VREGRARAPGRRWRTGRAGGGLRRPRRPPPPPPPPAARRPPPAARRPPPAARRPPPPTSTPPRPTLRCFSSGELGTSAPGASPPSPPAPAPSLTALRSPRSLRRTGGGRWIGRGRRRGRERRGGAGAGAAPRRRVAAARAWVARGARRGARAPLALRAPSRAPPDPPGHGAHPLSMRGMNEDESSSPRLAPLLEARVPVVQGPEPGAPPPCCCRA